VTDRLAAAWAARSTIAAVYARLYAAVAVWCVAVPFFPLLEDVQYKHGAPLHYGSLLDMAGRNAADPASIGLVLDAVLVVLLIIGTIGAVTPAVPGAIAVLSALLALLLIVRPGTASPTPPLAPAGAAGLAIAVLLLVVSATHAVHVRSIRLYPAADD
jgi:hypothetical protein